jgi:hypothetical protein
MDIFKHKTKKIWAFLKNIFIKDVFFKKNVYFLNLFNIFGTQQTFCEWWMYNF